MAYVQSDEITLVLKDESTSEPFFNWRLSKLISISASMASGMFMLLYAEKFGLDKTKPIQFDCRAWSVPNINEAYAWLLFRQIDCIRNSKQQAAQTYISHKELLGKNADQQIELLKDREGIDWLTTYTAGEKYGRFVFKRKIIRDKSERTVWETRYAWDLSQDETKKILNDIE